MSKTTQIVKQWKSSEIKIKKDSKDVLWVVLGKDKVRLPKNIIPQTLKLNEAEELLNKAKKEDVRIDKDYIFSLIITAIESGMSLRKALKSLGEKGLTMSSKTFFKMIEDDEEKVKHYARACEERADSIFEEILDITDEIPEDSVAVQHAKLKVDARKWVLAKINPRKYGDKTDITSNGETITTPARILTKEEAKDLLKGLDNEY